VSVGARPVPLSLAKDLVGGGADHHPQESMYPRRGRVRAPTQRLRRRRDRTGRRQMLLVRRASRRGAGWDGWFRHQSGSGGDVSVEALTGVFMAVPSLLIGGRRSGAGIVDRGSLAQADGLQPRHRVLRSGPPPSRSEGPSGGPAR
jgi:hypothetical protein